MDLDFLYKKIDQLKSNIVDFIPTFLFSIFILIIFYVIAEYFKKYIMTSIKINNQEQHSISIIYYQLSTITYYFILAMGLIFALVNLGFNVATIITILGTIGLALGLAFQETFKNIIASVCISINNLYTIGDVIIIKVLGYQNPTIGTVIDFDLYTTKIIESKTSLLTIIPNSTISNNIISNISRSQGYLQS
jgi:small conductance mechanosensitive channel